MQCPLCHAQPPHLFHKDNKRSYYQCFQCQLIFVPTHERPCIEEEKRIYDQHQNNPENKGYCDFLNQLCEPLKKYIHKGAQGLDFGSGPGPTLSVILEDQGYQVDLFDALYAPDQSVFTKKYDFITATEVFEHLHNPKEEVERLWRLLKPGGVLAIMTQHVTDKKSFETWHYIRDPSHVCFYSRTCFDFIAAQLKAKIHHVHENVVFFIS
jgi:SAM-dependent methyltransferase